jgi:hypothetical protein
VFLHSLAGELWTASSALGAEPVAFFLFQLCDVVLKIGADTIHAHRVVLASVSPYFYAMFNGKCHQATERLALICYLSVLVLVRKRQALLTVQVVLLTVPHLPKKFHLILWTVIKIENNMTVKWNILAC